MGLVSGGMAAPEGSGMVAREEAGSEGGVGDGVALRMGARSPAAGAPDM